MTKKKILFIIESLIAAGGEKSLITLLNHIDYNRYQVDLQLLSFGGEFERYIPKNVKVLPPHAYARFVKHQTSGTLLMRFAKLMYSATIRIGSQTHKARARKYWQHIGPCIEKNIQHYDIAIAYGQCLPTFYVIDKIKATQKLAWINCIYHLEGHEREWQRRFYDSVDKIVLVSPAALEHFKGVYPDMADKMYYMPDLISPSMITQMAESELPKYPFNSTDDIKVLTVARLDKNDKGYDITLEACKILRDRGLRFKWYALGRGPYRDEMIRFIKENNLLDTFILLGTTPNPYPYIKDCTLYVQTSRHEGYGLSIAEARILNKPVVTTEFDAVYNQMVSGKNGLVVPQDPTAVADAIERLLNDQELYDSIVAYQQQEKKGNTEEIEKFYQLIS